MNESQKPQTDSATVKVKSKLTDFERELLRLLEAKEAALLEFAEDVEALERDHPEGFTGELLAENQRWHASPEFAEVQRIRERIRQEAQK